MQLQLTLYLEQGPQGGGYQKLTFHGGGLVVPVMIIIAGAGTPQSLKYACELHDDLRAELQTLSLRLDPNFEQAHDPFVEAQQTALVETQKLLVLVGEEGGVPPQKLHTNTTTLHEAWLTQGSPYSILPIYPERAPVLNSFRIWRA